MLMFLSPQTLVLKEEKEILKKKKLKKCMQKVPT